MPKRPLLIALAVLLLDRITKWAIGQTIPLEDAINIIPGFFRLTHLENTGAAFSLFADSTSPFRTALLIAFSVAALAVICFLLWKDRNVFNAGTLALSLILGGAVAISGTVWLMARSPTFWISTSALTTGRLLTLPIAPS